MLRLLRFTPSWILTGSSIAGGRLAYPKLQLGSHEPPTHLEREGERCGCLIQKTLGRDFPLFSSSSSGNSLSSLTFFFSFKAMHFVIGKKLNLMRSLRNWKAGT